MKKGWNNIEIKKLVKADWNYKEENQILTEKLLTNFKRNGQIESIIVRELDTGFFEVVNGNHRLDVMKMLEYKTAHCYNFGKITQLQASRVAIETNETKFATDPLKLSNLIQEITKEYTLEDIEKTMPYDIKDLENMVDITKLDWNDFTSTPPDTLDDVEFNKTINLKVTEETYKRWIELKDRLKELSGYATDSKVFEFAVIEALNIPLESYQ